MPMATYAHGNFEQIATQFLGLNANTALAKSGKNSKANRSETMKGSAESGEICSVDVEEK
jgi:hypothetical protein